MTPQTATATGDSAHAQQAPARGWQARLTLGFVRRAGRTVLHRRRHEGPLLVQRPFYPEGEPCHAYLIHPPGGVVGGDELMLEVDVDEQAHALITTPAAGKFYRSAGPAVRLHQRLTVRGTLEWLPQENIFYPGAQVRAVTHVTLTPGARFLGWEISCYGLPARAAAFTAGCVCQGFELWHADRPLLLERLRMNESGLRARWGLAGRVACGTLLAYPATLADLAVARSGIASRAGGADRLVEIAATVIDEVLLVRAMGARADHIRGSFTQLWSSLRPALIGRNATVPRIWAT